MDPGGVLEGCVAFARALIRTPSMSGREADLARLVAREMTDLGYDDVWIDPHGNVNGRVRGSEPSLPALVLNAHLDHVDPGDPRLWRHPPFDAEVANGRIYGRGAADIKGPLAVQTHAVGAVIASGRRPRRDVVVSAVVEEEVGGGGAIAWAREVDYPIALIVLGEPSDNRLALGHRGIRQLWLTFHGVSAHASAPERAQNPAFALGSFLARLEDARDALGTHPVLGATTVSPTILGVDTTSPNVTPAWARVLLDFRTATESLDDLLRFVDGLAGDWPHSVGNPWADDPTASPAPDDRIIVGFYTPPDDPRLQRAHRLLSDALGEAPALTSYRFATDGRHFVGLGAAIAGYSAAEEAQAHVADESISIAKMALSLRGHMALVSAF